MNSEYGLYLYGSAARGDSVSQSDVDVLVLFESGESIDKEKIAIPEEVMGSVSCSDISFYSLKRIKEMYGDGHLFAWHLHNEAKFLDGKFDRLSELGRPSEYCGFFEDAESLFGLLVSIPENLMASPGNLTYEAGIAYVCARNIAMSASYYSPNGLTFSAFAPFMLGYADNSFTLSLEQYSALRQARLAGTRGLESPEIDVRELLSNVQDLAYWCQFEIERVRRIIQ